MNNEIIFVCNSTNNKNVRANELKILRKLKDKMYFEFGESESNIKVRYYTKEEQLNKDFEALQKIKKQIEEEAKMEENASYNEEDAEMHLTDEESGEMNRARKKYYPKSES